MFDFLNAYWRALKKKEYLNLELVCLNKIRSKVSINKYIQYLIWAQKCQKKSSEAVRTFIETSEKYVLKEKTEMYILKIIFDFDLYVNNLNFFVLDTINNEFINLVKSKKGKIRSLQLRIAAAQNIGDIEKVKRDLTRLREINFKDETLVCLEQKYLQK